jgi:hypothetical protein
LKDSHVTASRDAGAATVTVTGTVVTVVPLLSRVFGVRVTATGPVERYVPPVPPAGAGVGR